MLDSFLERIAYVGPIGRDSDTLRHLHRAWRRRVPYENLDIQLGAPISLEPEDLLDKIVRRRRGGYCFEQNGALAILLKSAGFEVTLAEGAVQREQRGESAWGNHNVLIVDLDGQRWIADAGIGDGFIDPLPLREGTYTEQGREFRLERLESDLWRFHHHPGASISSYDYRLDPRELTDFAGRSHEFSTDPASTYVNILMAARPDATGTRLLLSRTVRHLGVERGAPHVISSLDEFVDVLARQFLIPIDELGTEAAERLWEKSGQQHDVWSTRQGTKP